ncbi:hypothetical protein [Oribacterium sp. FC2011]|uniref:hypothetical protein n=1 Tax=Oribacterium sp. FC2011 TaxID=1408311 RepID=UPI0004E12E51|nr:hypothetical protein [Oribacterium sp. FC2011]
MALKLKEYKNGIYGLKCGKHYVVPSTSENDKYDVIDSKRDIVSQGFSDIEDAQWAIKYYELSPRKKEIFDKIAKMAIWELSGIMEQYIRGDDVLGNPDDNEWLYKTVLALRHRKKYMKPEIPGNATSFQKLKVEEKK